MKKQFILPLAIVALLLIPGLRAYADIDLLDTNKNKLQFYGFFKLDAAYQDGGVNGLTFPRYAVAGEGNLYLTATHTRFGFKYAGTPLSNRMNVGAVLEWDFFDATSPNQMKPRFRQGYFTLSKRRHTVLFGQAWDLFSPLGPTTLMTNGFLWQTGNLGFRHAQARYTYTAPRFDFAASVNDQASEGGRTAKMPVLQSRLGFKLGASNKYQVGVSGIYGREDAKSFLNPVSNKVNIAGISFDWNLATGKWLSFKGEFATGENLAYVASRAGYWLDPVENEMVTHKASSFWSELLLSKNKYSGWLGYGFEDLTIKWSEGGTKEMRCLFAGIQYAAGSGVSFGLEFAHFSTVAPLLEPPKTNQLMFSAVLNL
jgi:hypothetical protein